MSRGKFTLEEKLRILVWIDEGHGLKDAANKFEVNAETIRQWRIKLAAHGIEALSKQARNTRYSMKLKTQAVESYLARQGSQDDICLRYGIRSTTQLQRWILKYTQGEVLKSSPKGGSSAMNKGRKTTYEERQDIVQYCIAHDNNYQETAERYQFTSRFTLGFANITMAERRRLLIAEAKPRKKTS